jgi:predicted DNA-binding transcriptional regulator YafY
MEPEPEVTTYEAGPVNVSVSLPPVMPYDVEYRAATERRVLWIQYYDVRDNETQREIEVYRPSPNDDYICCWCRLVQEPRVFNRIRIEKWKLLDKRFDSDPLVERYLMTEGRKPKDERIPWKRWRSMQRE